MTYEEVVKEAQKIVAKGDASGMCSCASAICLRACSRFPD